jgi:hypothetical protein
MGRPAVLTPSNRAGTEENPGGRANGIFDQLRHRLVVQADRSPHERPLRRQARETRGGDPAGLVWRSRSSR